MSAAQTLPTFLHVIRTSSLWQNYRTWLLKKTTTLLNSKMHWSETHNYTTSPLCLPSLYFVSVHAPFQKEKKMRKGKIPYGKFKHTEVKQFKVTAAKGTWIQPSTRSLQGTQVKTTYCNRLQCTDTKELLQLLRENISLHLSTCWLSLSFV